MLRADRAFLTSVSIAGFCWIAAGVATGWVTLSLEQTTYPVIYLLWLHSIAIVATINAVALAALRAFQRQLREPDQAYALGLEHGVELAGSINR